MQPSTCVSFKFAIPEKEFERLETWGVAKPQTRTWGGCVVTAIYCHDPLDITGKLPEFKSTEVERVTARLPAFEDHLVPARYVDRDHRAEIVVRATKEGQNGAEIRFFTVFISAPGLPELAAAYVRLLTGKLEPEQEYGPKHEGGR